MEAVTARRPIIFGRPTAGNEEGNLRFAVGLGVGAAAGRSTGRFLAAWRRFTSPAGQAAVARAYTAAEKAAATDGARSIARRIDQLARGTDPAGACFRPERVNGV